MYSRRIVFCVTGLSPEERERLRLEPVGAERFSPPTESNPGGWCHVKESELSFESCASCPLNEGFREEQTHTLKADTVRGFKKFRLTIA
jgi:hypothetical protein